MATTEITQYKKNVVVLPTAYLKDRGSANLRMFLRKENSGTIFFIGNDPTNNALKLPYNVPCHNNKLDAAAAGALVDVIEHSQFSISEKEYQEIEENEHTLVRIEKYGN